MLVFDPNKRITIKEALQSPYVLQWTAAYVESHPVDEQQDVPAFSLDYENDVTLEGFRGE